MIHQMFDLHRRLLVVDCSDRRISAIPNRCVGKFRQILGDRIIKLKATLLVEHHGRNGGHGLTHGVDAYDGVCIHDLAIFFVSKTRRLQIGNLTAPCD